MRAALAWLLVALTAGWVLTRLLGLERGFPLVPLMAFTPVAAAGAALLVAVAAALRQRTAALAAAGLAAALVVTVTPRAVGGPTDAAGPRLRVLTVNMRYGGGSPDALVALARRADVLSVQELTPELARALDAAGLPDVMPERVVDARRGSEGIGLYAHRPLERRTVPGRRHNPLVAAALAVGGGLVVEVVAVHSTAPVRWQVGAWRDDLRALPSATPRGPLRVLAGDFNATLDHAELRRLLDTGYEDAAAEIGAGLRGTWPAGRRLPPPVAIDHVLADPRIGVRAYSVQAIPGTDHRAVLAELVLPQTSSAGGRPSSSARIP